VVSGAEAPNYTITYVSGVLTVEADPTGISTVSANRENAPLYDLQGRRVTKTKRGIYIRGNRKTVKR